MSQTAAPSTPPSSFTATPPSKTPLTVSIVIGIAGLFLFLASQVCVTTAAAIWAIGGYLHLGLAGFAVLCLVLVPAALYLCWKILVMAIEAERDPANN